MRDATDIARFLVRAWSENPNVKITIGETFGSDPERQTIVLPDYYEERTDMVSGNLNGMTKWRTYRFVSWHEAMHELMSPKSKSQSAYKITEYVIHNLPLYLSPSASIMGKPSIVRVASALIGIVEDYRIEKVGIRTYKGYEKEKAMFEAIASVGAQTARVNRDAMNTSDLSPEDAKSIMYDRWIGEFAENLFFGFPTTKDYEGLLEVAGQVETYDDVHSVCVSILNMLIRKLGLPPKNYDPPNHTREHSQISDEDAKRAEKDGEFGEADDSTRSQYERIEEERKRLESEQQKRLAAIGGAAGVNHLMNMRVIESWGGGDYQSMMEGTRLTIQRLQTLLRKWQIGWREVINHMGDDIDPEQFIMSRVDKRDNRYYISEKRITQKGNIAIMLDMSGSIGSLDHVYKQMVGVISESLSFVGTKFSLCAFNDGGEGGNFYAIKTLNEEWGRRQKERLSSLRSSGGTPLTDALNWVQSFDKQDHYAQIIIVSDGAPNNPDRCNTLVRKMRVGGKRLSLIIYSQDKKTSYIMERETPELFRRSGNLRVIGDMRELPNAFFELVKPLEEA